MNRFTLLTTALMSISFGALCYGAQQLEFKDGHVVVNHGSWWGLPTLTTTGSTLVKPGATYLVDTVNKQIQITGNGSTGPQVAFDNIGIEEGYTTATPGHLLYKNYIGYIDYTINPHDPLLGVMLKNEDSKKGIGGKKNRLYFCDGECVRK